MFVPRARTYLAATALRDFGWRTTYVLLSLPPLRERNMFTSSSSSSSAAASPSPTARGENLRSLVYVCDRAPRRVASRRVAVPVGTWEKKRERREMDVARKMIARLAQETARATSSLLSYLIS